MSYFKPMLADKDLTMCQDVTPNTAEKKEMMYAITWNEAGTRMIQIGIEPTRLLQELKQNEISNVVSDMPLYKGIEIFVADAGTKIVKGATDRTWIGEVLDDLGIATDRVNDSKTVTFHTKVNGKLCRCFLCLDDTYIIAVTMESSFYLRNNIYAVFIVGIYLVLASCCMVYMLSRVLKEKYEKQQETKKLLETMKGQEDITLDGKKMLLYCNIGSPEDVAAVLANDGQGIGLFRSEFLYLSASDYPTEDEQFEAYRSVAAAMNGKRVVIRTLDIGADKQVDYFNMKEEENPALGVRAIRICLNRPEVFRTQLRALYRASVYGKIAIMFPMITSVWEVKECKRACVSVMKELEAEGIPYNKDTELGIMIETPSSVFVAEELAKLVDFFSVGTNDLTQYTLACDRQANDLGKFYDPHHPALLRAIKMAADAAHKAGIWIDICGELGADVSMLPTFLAMGIDELSVSPSAVLPVRAAIRQSIAQTCTLEMLEC